MKKIIFILLSIGFFSFSFSSFPKNELRNQLEIYPTDFYEALLSKEKIKNHNSEEELNEIKRILEKEDLVGCFGKNIYPKKYFLKDLNFDGQKELIFNGGCNPYPEVQIFSKKENGNYKSIFRHGGFIQTMSIDEHDQKIIINNEPCCCAYFGSISIISKIKKNEVEASSAIYHMSLLVPSVKFMMLPSSKFLTIDNPCTGNPYQENFLIEIKKGTLAEKLYGFGNWAFVLLKPNFEIIENKFNQIDSNDDYVFGWVKNSDLKEEDF